MNPTLPTAGVPTGTNFDPARPGGASVRAVFRRFATLTSGVMGSPWAFTIATLVIIVWALLGHHFHYSDTWQLVINTGTTIVTFLMVFLIQNTQNRDARAIQLKLDELIRSNNGPRNQLINLENCSEEEMAKLEAEFQEFRNRHRTDTLAADADDHP